MSLGRHHPSVCLEQRGIGGLLGKGDAGGEVTAWTRVFVTKCLLQSCPQAWGAELGLGGSRGGSGQAVLSLPSLCPQRPLLGPPAGQQADADGGKCGRGGW